MKKIKLQLTRHELRNLIGFLEFVLHKEQFPATKSKASKLVVATLTELFVRLNKTWDLFKTDFKFSITVTHGLALVEYCTADGSFVPNCDTLTINKVIGIIDQTTPLKYGTEPNN